MIRRLIILLLIVGCNIEPETCDYGDETLCLSELYYKIDKYWFEGDSYDNGDATQTGHYYMYRDSLVHEAEIKNTYGFNYLSGFRRAESYIKVKLTYNPDTYIISWKNSAYPSIEWGEVCDSNIVELKYYNGGKDSAMVRCTALEYYIINPDHCCDWDY